MLAPNAALPDDYNKAEGNADDQEKWQIDDHRDRSQHDRDLKSATGYFQHVCAVHLVVSEMLLSASLF
jgi:hypothetical protein